MGLYEKEISITPKILKFIAEIDEFKGRWSGLGQLVPERLTSIKKIATIESIASSTLGMTKLELDQFSTAFEHSERVAVKQVIAH